MQAKILVRAVDCVLTNVRLTAAPVTFCADVPRADRASIWKHDDDCRGESGDHGETKCAGAGGGIDLDALFDKDPL